MELHDWWARDERRRLRPRKRLSNRDLLLLERLCRGQSSKQMAAELDVSKVSVDSRCERLLAKLDLPSRRAAARMAVECGLIEADGWNRCFLARNRRSRRGAAELD